jgi:penicillin amidase
MTISIIRDSWGIGHASAPDTDGAFWAQGWLAASDRIWQMEWDRLRGQGRWAEVVGTSGVREDTFFRRLDLGSVARSDWSDLATETRRMTESYSAGVNAWLEANDEALPAEFKAHPNPPAPWEPWHCVLVYKVRHLFMGTFHRKLWRGAVLSAAGPEATGAMRSDPADASPIVPGAGALASPDHLVEMKTILTRSADELAAISDTDGGSNSWAVHGSRTASGLPILAGDPHRAIEFPNVYYQCHIACPSFDAIGLSFPGVPGFPHFGHNADVAWCITHGMADDTDVFVETGAVEWAEDTIEVADEDPVTIVTGTTARGPVVLGDGADGSPVLSMMWTGLHGSDSTLDALVPMLRASSCADLEEAVRPWVIPVNNLLTADRHGDISFKVRGRMVDRPVANRWTPVPGDPVHAWTNLEPVGYDDLPGWRNPDRGYLVTANNRIADAGPYFSLDFAGPSRHDRIAQLLEGLDAATNADMQAIHRDVRSLVAPPVVALLRQCEPTTAQGRQAIALFVDWDHQMLGESAAAAFYGACRRHWAAEVGRRLGVLEPELGGAGWPDPVGASRMLLDAATTLLRGDGWKVIDGIDTEADLMRVLAAVADAAAFELTETLDAEPTSWRWDSNHVMVSPHPLARAMPYLADLHPPVDGCPGDGDTVRAGGVAPVSGDKAVFASVGRYVFDLADWDASGWVVPHGVSGVRGGGHDLDQRKAWLAGNLLPMAYSAQAVAGVAVETFTVEP